jgi:hypothetical protein
LKDVVSKIGEKGMDKEKKGQEKNKKNSLKKFDKIKKTSTFASRFAEKLNEKKRRKVRGVRKKLESAEPEIVDDRFINSLGRIEEALKKSKKKNLTR